MHLLGVINTGAMQQHPQSKAVCEQTHQTVATLLKKTLALISHCKSWLANDAFATAMHALHWMVATMLREPLQEELRSLGTCFFVFLFLHNDKQSLLGERSY